MLSQREIFGSNLERILVRKDVDQKVLAEYLGVSEASVSNWTKGLKYPRIHNIQKMADFLNVSKSELIEQKPTNIIEVSQRTVQIPVLGPIACGDPILVEENFEDYRTELEDRLPTGNLFYLQAKGDSMHPEITDGSMVLLREQPDVENGEIAAVMLNGNTEATLKRVKKQDGMIILMPANPAHEPIFVNDKNPAQIIGKVMRSERTH